MHHNIKKLFASLLAASFVFANAHATDLSQFPAITFQMHNQGLLKTKYAKIQSEENYGLWIAFDNKESTIHYKIIQEEGAPAAINLGSLKQTITTTIEENKQIIKSYLDEYIDLQEAKYYISLVQENLQGIQVPSIGSLNTELLNNATNHAPKDLNKTHVEVDFDRLWNRTRLRIASTIEIWQKKLGISPVNAQEINNLYQTVQRYIDTHPTNVNPQKYNDSFSLSLNFENFSHNLYGSQLHESQKPHTVQFAQIKNWLVKKVVKKDVAAEYKTTISAFFYLPPVEEQYGEKFSLSTVEEKIGILGKILEEKKRKSIFRENAFDKLKQQADGAVSLIIAQIKKQQVALNAKIDSVCNKLKSFFG